MTPDEQLADDMAGFYADPLGHVLYSYPWDTDRTIQMVKLPEKYRKRLPNAVYGPDLWACEFLDDLGYEIAVRGFDGRNAVTPIRFATASGHGIGKSVMAAWLIKFIMDTRPHAKGVVTAGTDAQLRTKTWAELGKWHKMSMTEHWFDYNTGRGAMSLTHKKHKETWRVDAQTSREENSESFAGLHAANSTPFYLFDEASGVGDKIYEVRDGGLTDGEPMVFDFGNPTRNSGRFFEECVGELKHRYMVRMIDSRAVHITNKAYIEELIQDFGVDSDRVKVRVKGEFPSVGSTQFIPTADVNTAQDRIITVDRFAPLIIGVDVARFGDDDSVIYPRLGYDARSYFTKDMIYSGLRTTQLVGKVQDVVNQFREMGIDYAAIFVDGTGLGAGVVDQLFDLGYKVFDIQFGSSPTDSGKYRYKSDEMWGGIKDNLHRLVLPSGETELGRALAKELTQREFGYTLTGNKIHLETKKDMKDRGVGSPDISDALALTFAASVVPAGKAHGTQNAQKSVVSDYDPLETED